LRGVWEQGPSDRGAGLNLIYVWAQYNKGTPPFAHLIGRLYRTVLGVPDFEEVERPQFSGESDAFLVGYGS
jgi:hypothetical protein